MSVLIVHSESCTRCVCVELLWCVGCLFMCVYLHVCEEKRGIYLSTLTNALNFAGLGGHFGNIKFPFKVVGKVCKMSFLVFTCSRCDALLLRFTQNRH